LIKAGFPEEEDVDMEKASPCCAGMLGCLLSWKGGTAVEGRNGCVFRDNIGLGRVMDKTGSRKVAW